MRFGKLLCIVNALIFIIYGLFYIFVPAEISFYVTESIPTTVSGLIDMRATYGGMAVAVGLVLGYLSLKNETLPTAILILLVYMLAMAAGRVLGLVVDGAANNKMYYYLISEIIIDIVCMFWLKLSIVKENEND